MEIKKSKFGVTQSGETVYSYRLINDHSYFVEVITYGGTITQIHVPDNTGRASNVVLSYDHLAPYENRDLCPYFGCITGPVAGRIAEAKLTLDGKDYLLDANDGSSCLHGGKSSLDQEIWSAKSKIEDQACQLTLSYLAKDYNGFPGTVDIQVTYTWTNDNSLRLTYDANTDKKTLLTLTNHTYFNLSGDPSFPILDHQVQLDCDRFVELNQDSLPVKIADVKATAFDFTKEKTIQDGLDKGHPQFEYTGGFDHPFIFNTSSFDYPKGIVKDPKSGRQMTLRTSEELVVVYSGNYLTKDMTPHGKPAKKHSGICFETQYYPDALNHDFIKPNILEPKDHYHSTTEYTFSISE